MNNIGKAIGYFTQESIFWFVTLYIALCSFVTVVAWESRSVLPFLDFFGYSNWFPLNGLEAFGQYFLGRPWHIVPAVVFSVSLVSVCKVLITGECSLFRGLKLSNVLEFNFLVAGLFIAPMAVEVGVFLVLLALLCKGLAFVVTRFDNACSCEEKNRATEADKPVNTENLGEIENKAETIYYKTKKYPRGR